MPKTIRDNKSDGDTVNYSGGNVDGKHSVDTTITDKSNSRRNLPSNAENYGQGTTVNWNGSSYSGADIKVVVNLYQESNYYKEIEDEIAFTTELIQGAENIANGYKNIDIISFRIKTTSEQRKAFIKMSKVSGTAVDKLVEDIFEAISTNEQKSGLSFRAKFYLETFYKPDKEALEEALKAMKDAYGTPYTTFPLQDLQTLSVQTHTEKFPVRGCGTKHVKGYTDGPMTIAGSMIFTVFGEHPLTRLVKALAGRESGYIDPALSSMLPSQLPPIDIIMAFANEYGSISVQRLYGIEFVNDGVTYSTEDMITEQVLSFVARDIDIMTKEGQVNFGDELSFGDLLSFEGVAESNSASNLLINNHQYESYLERIGIRRRNGLVGVRNPPPKKVK